MSGQNTVALARELSGGSTLEMRYVLPGRPWPIGYTNRSEGTLVVTRILEPFSNWSAAKHTVEPDKEVSGMYIMRVQTQEGHHLYRWTDPRGNPHHVYLYGTTNEDAERARRNARNGLKRAKTGWRLAHVYGLGTKLVEQLLKQTNTGLAPMAADLAVWLLAQTKAETGPALQLAEEIIALAPSQIRDRLATLNVAKLQPDLLLKLLRGAMLILEHADERSDDT